MTGKIIPLTAAEALKTTGSVTEAAKLLGVPRTTFYSRLASEMIAGGGRQKNFGEVVTLRAQLQAMKAKLAATEQALHIAKEIAKPVALTKFKPGKHRKTTLGTKHLFIPDVQAKDGVPLEHMRWAGEFAAAKRPDTIVFAGDVGDMPSLSSYDKGKLQFEGRRYKIDIEATRAAMELFLAPIRKTKGYRPRIVLTYGNHEARIDRCVEDNPILSGTISKDDFQFEAMGIETHEFLATVEIDGVTYAHFFPRSARGRIVQTRQGAPSATAQLVRQGGSAIAGHAQGLDAAPLFLNGKLQWGIIAGSFYQHDEPYLGPQGTVYWRGIVMLHEVKEGKLNPMFVTLDYLREKFG